MDPETKTRWSSRKFWLMVFVWVACVGLLISDNITEKVFESLTFLTVGGYLLGNVAQKYVERP
jgi:hypothetical protein